MQLEIAPRAEEDLSEIVEFIARDKPDAARHWLGRLRDLLVLIADKPLLFPLERTLGLGFRQAPFGKYLVFFRAQGDRVRIERVLHGMRDLPKHLP